MNFFFSSRRRHTFFFQAEDGIRDRSPSRGLGDVYKRQEVATTSHDTPIKKGTDPVSNLPTTILLVDDNDINLRLLIAFMKKLNCDYVIAQNGEEALEAFKANSSAIGMIFMGRFL